MKNRRHVLLDPEPWSDPRDKSRGSWEREKNAHIDGNNTGESFPILYPLNRALPGASKTTTNCQRSRSVRLNQQTSALILKGQSFLGAEVPANIKMVVSPGFTPPQAELVPLEPTRIHHKAGDNRLPAARSGTGAGGNREGLVSSRSYPADRSIEDHSRENQTDLIHSHSKIVPPTQTNILERNSLLQVPCHPLQQNNNIAHCLQQQQQQSHYQYQLQGHQPPLKKNNVCEMQVLQPTQFHHAEQQQQQRQQAQTMIVEDCHTEVSPLEAGSFKQVPFQMNSPEDDPERPFVPPTEIIVRMKGPISLEHQPPQQQHHHPFLSANKVQESPPVPMKVPEWLRVDMNATPPISPLNGGEGGGHGGEWMMRDDPPPPQHHHQHHHHHHHHHQNHHPEYNHHSWHVIHPEDEWLHEDCVVPPPPTSSKTPSRPLLQLAPQSPFRREKVTVTKTRRRASMPESMALCIDTTSPVVRSSARQQRQQQEQQQQRHPTTRRMESGVMIPFPMPAPRNSSAAITTTMTVLEQQQQKQQPQQPSLRQWSSPLRSNHFFRQESNPSLTPHTLASDNHRYMRSTQFAASAPVSPLLPVHKSNKGGKTLLGQGDEVHRGSSSLPLLPHLAGVVGQSGSFASETSFETRQTESSEGESYSTGDFHTGFHPRLNMVLEELDHHHHKEGDALLLEKSISTARRSLWGRVVKSPLKMKKKPVHNSTTKVIVAAANSNNSSGNNNNNSSSGSNNNNNNSKKTVDLQRTDVGCLT
jgi:hypothetical protein